MRSRWKKLCQWAISILSLAFAPMSAQAQFGLGGGTYSQLPPTPAHSLRGEAPPGPNDPPPFTMKDDGRPNAFTSVMDVQSHDSLPLFPPFFKRGVDRLRPGIIFPILTPARTAEFPNPAEESNEPVSPFSMREEGVANAFTKLKDPRWRGPATQALHGTRSLFTELFNPPPQLFSSHIINLRGEFLYWRFTNGPIAVPLVTTNNNPTIASVGQLGDPATTVLLNSGNIVDYGVVPGLRLSAEVTTFFTPPIELSGFTFERTQTLFSGGSLTNPAQLLAIPYQDIDSRFIIPPTTIGSETAQVISIPIGSAVGAQGGTIDITSNLVFWGIDAKVYLPLGESDLIGLRLSVGYKHMTLRENIRIFTQSGGVVGGTQFNGFRLPDGIFSNTTTDNFETTNNFDGGTIGLRGTLNRQRWSLNADVNFGFGPSTYDVNINGNTVLVPVIENRATQSADGGILALHSNSGITSVSALALTFEASVGLSFQVNQAIRLFGGFNYLWWSPIARPGDYINNTIDARQIPSSASFSPVPYNGPAAIGSVTQRDLRITGAFLGVEIGF
ncbi:MAG: hypothetical protein EXS16_11710 [Gemmataceae bacterium]|nr:hypothetical protein [Gemmataceae bacterium]